MTTENSGIKRRQFLQVLGTAGIGSMAGAVSYRPEIAGTSSGLSSALGLVLSGGFSILSGVIYAGSFTPIALLMALGATLTAVTGWMVRPVVSEAREG